MPIIPTVFRPIRSNDFQRRAFQAYKNYHISASDVATTASGYVAREAHFIRQTNLPVGDYTAYDPGLNSADNSYPHIIWRSLDHRYYKHPYDPGRSSELTNRKVTTKQLHESASTLTLPYLDVGERVKAGSVNGTFNIGLGDEYTLEDDGYGNLRDPLIQTSSMATSSRCFFYLSFNPEFRKLRGRDPIHNQSFNDPQDPTAASKQFKSNQVAIMRGIDSSGGFGGALDDKKIGFSAVFNHRDLLPANKVDDTEGHDGSRIIVPHDKKFNNFGKCDDWTISFWFDGNLGIQDQNASTRNVHPLLSKIGRSKETYRDTIKSVNKRRFNTAKLPCFTASFASRHTPFMIYFEETGSVMAKQSGSIHFKASDGSHEFHISSSGVDYTFGNYSLTNWRHISIRNSSSTCSIFLDGVASGTSGSLPKEITANNDDFIIGAPISSSADHYVNTYNKLAEIRMYDYACSGTELSSLANKHYLSASCLQTNVAGNVFYRNGEFVVSSAMPKYHSGSGAFANNFRLNYKGTHTIYENEVLVRVPMDQMNVSMNPTANFKPTNQGTTGCEPYQRNTLTGEYRKHMFISGTALPYITTIGLYNDDAQLLAIGKPSQAIQKRDDADMNFIVRWDY